MSEKAGACYQCNEVGHFSRECPTSTSSYIQIPKPIIQNVTTVVVSVTSPEIAQVVNPLLFSPI